MAATHITDANFDQEVLHADMPVLVDFYATWCGPCKQLAPTIDDLADTSAGKYKVVKLDVDENNVTAGKYQVMSIPTLIFFKGGEVVDKVVGVVDKGALQEKLMNLM